MWVWTETAGDEKSIWVGPSPTAATLWGFGEVGWDQQRGLRGREGARSWGDRCGQRRAEAAQRRFSLLQLPGTRPRRSAEQQRSRLCPSASRLPYVLAFLRFLVVVRIFLKHQEGLPSALD